MSTLDKLNKMILKGECPLELDFNQNHNQHATIDYEMVKYNAFYKSYGYAQSKFPDGFDVIPGFDKIIESCIPTITPLEEIDMKNLIDEMKLCSCQLPLEEYQKQEEKDLKILYAQTEELLLSNLTCEEQLKQYEDNLKIILKDYDEHLSKIKISNDNI
jgi:hypothetical protein